MSGLVLWSTVALAAPSEAVWSLEAPGDWSAGELALLDSIAAAVPTPEAPVRLRRTQEALSGPLDAMTHAVVKPRRQGGLLVVSTVGLDQAVAAAAPGADSGEVAAMSEEVLRRRLVHGLMHRLDSDHGWSEEPMWMGLSEWGAGKPGERDPLSYAEVRGMASSAEDLAVLTEHAFMGRSLPWDPPMDAACRMRSKWRLLTEWLDTPGVTSSETCPSLAQVGLDPEKIEAVDVIYVQASTRSPASLAGHLGLGLVYAGDDGRQREIVYQLGADTEDVKMGSLQYIVRGIWGGFQGLLLWEPYRRTVLRYAEEGRSVSRLRLHLTASQKERLLERLDDLRQSWQRSYRFFTRNCSHMPKAVLEWAFNEAIPLPTIFGPDAVLAHLERNGRLDVLPGRSLDEFSRYDRARLSETLQEATAEHLSAECRSDCSALEAALKASEGRSAEQRASGYVALRSWAASGGDPASVQRYLVWSEQLERSRLPRDSKDSPALQALWTALLQPGPSSDSIGAPTSDAVSQATETLRVALEHDIRGQQTTSSAHTPLNRVQLGAGARQVNGGTASTLSMGTALYSARLGESRRYASASGLDLRLLRSDVTLISPASRTAQLEADVEFLRLRRIWGDAWGMNPGLHAGLVRMQRKTDISGTQVTVDIAELGGLLELWQHDRHRHNLLLGAGVSGGVQGDWSTRSLAPLVETPVRLLGRLGSATDPLTGLSLEAAWYPELLQHGRLEALLSAQHGLGEVRDVGLALAADVRLQSTESGTTYEALLGFWIERF